MLLKPHFSVPSLHMLQPAIVQHSVASHTQLTGRWPAE